MYAFSWACVGANFFQCGLLLSVRSAEMRGIRGPESGLSVITIRASLRDFLKMMPTPKGGAYFDYLVRKFRFVFSHFFARQHFTQLNVFTPIPTHLEDQVLITPEAQS